MQAACASAFPAASLGQLFLWLHDTALIFIEAGQTLASYAVHVADRCRLAAAARGKVRAGSSGVLKSACFETDSHFVHHHDQVVSGRQVNCCSGVNPWRGRLAGAVMPRLSNSALKCWESRWPCCASMRHTQLSLPCRLHCAGGGGVGGAQLVLNAPLCESHAMLGLTPAPGPCTAQEVAVGEGRGSFLYHVDAGGDIAAQALTLAHLAHIWARAGFSFSLVGSEC